MSMIKSQLKDHVLKLQIDRPDKKNALNLEMYTAMAAVLKQADENAAVRVVSIEGTKDCFTSGNDIKDFTTLANLTDAAPVIDFLQALSQCSKPIVAAVNGEAIGIGTTLLLHCDLVYVAEDSTFQLPFVNLGLCPEAASSLLLPSLLGHQRASELLLLGEVFNAQKAYDWGMVNGVLESDKVIEFVQKIASTLAEKPPKSLQITKALLKNTQSDNVLKKMTEEFTQFSNLLNAEEFKEAMQAFIEKRSPDFSKFD